MEDYAHASYCSNDDMITGSDSLLCVELRNAAANVGALLLATRTMRSSWNNRAVLINPALSSSANGTVRLRRSTTGD